MCISDTIYLCLLILRLHKSKERTEKRKKTRKSQPKESSKYFSIKLHFSKEFIEVAAVHWSNGKPAVVAASHTFCEDCLL